MSFIGLATMFMPAINKVLDLIPDSNARAEAREVLMMEMVRIESQQAIEQVKLNQVEAKHKSIFVAGWRPFIGWVGGVALAWTFVMYPLAVWIATLCGYTGTFPELETDALMTLVMAMLGIGAMRSFDKYQGTDTQSVGVPKSKPKFNE